MNSPHKQRVNAFRREIIHELAARTNIPRNVDETQQEYIDRLLSIGISEEYIKSIMTEINDSHSL